MDNYRGKTRILDAAIIYVISAPSGSGKTTIRKKLLRGLKGTVYSISHTTRKPRPAEIHGSDYFFISSSEFKKKIERGYFIEWARVHDNYYGTPRDLLESCIRKRKDILLDLDIKGCLNIKKKYPNSISIFLLPPSLNELKKRLKLRKEDSTRTINKRLKNAKGEIKKIYNYDYIVINDRLESAIKRIKDIISIEKMKATRNKEGIKRFIDKEF